MLELVRLGALDISGMSAEIHKQRVKVPTFAFKYLKADQLHSGGIWTEAGDSTFIC